LRSSQGTELVSNKQGQQPAGAWQVETAQAIAMAAVGEQQAR
jgi:hypothetical protein